MNLTDETLAMELRRIADDIPVGDRQHALVMEAGTRLCIRAEAWRNTFG